jgi:hypothetical protein
LAVGTSLWGTVALAQKSKKHPRLARALEDMKDAREYLKKAPHTFGGHKKKAIEALDEAIEQVGKAIEFDS